MRLQATKLFWAGVNCIQNGGDVLRIEVEGQRRIPDFQIVHDLPLVVGGFANRGSGNVRSDDDLGAGRGVIGDFPGSRDGHRAGVVELVGQVCRTRSLGMSGVGSGLRSHGGPLGSRVVGGGAGLLQRTVDQDAGARAAVGLTHDIEQEPVAIQ